MYATFLKNLLFLSLAGILAVLSINYFVDPYNVFFTTIKGFNHSKSEAKSRKASALNIIRFKPKTIVLGTSRAIQIGPESFKTLPDGDSFYNAGFNGAGFDEMYTYFLHALYVQPDLKRVILGIDLFSFNANRKPQWDFKEKCLQNQTVIIKELLFSCNALAVSFECCRSSFFESPQINPILEMGENTYLQKMLNSEENYKNYRIDPERISQFQSLVEICKSRSIELLVFVCPVKASYWEVYYQNGLWPHVENLKRQLCVFHPIWDFSGYNPLTMETLESNGVDLYLECSHFSAYTGDMLVKRMLGQTSSMDAIGYLLTPETVEASLVSILQQRSKELHRLQPLKDSQKQ